MEKSFQRQFALNIARLRLGKNTEQFTVDRSFFEAFGDATIEAAELTADLDIQKYETHLDVKFLFTGQLELACDRCGEPYPYSLQAENRVIYSFDEAMSFEGYEVMYVNRQEANLSLVQEFYDFVQLAIPIRKVPDESIHTCPPEVLNMLGLEEGSETEDKEIDPRWEALKKLKKSED